MSNINASSDNRMKAIESVPLVISVLSGKGGVGKSTASFQLGRILSESGRVLLADCDLLFGDLHIIANTIPQCTIDRYLLDDNNLRRPAVIDENLHLLASPSTSGRDLDTDVAGIVTDLPRLPEICTDYDYLIVDTPSGVIDVIAAVAAISDIRLISVMPDLTAISDGYGLIKYLKTLGISGPHYLLPNRCRNADEAAFIYAKFAEICKKFLKFRPECLGYVLENQYLTARFVPSGRGCEPGRFDVQAEDIRDLARAILAVKPKPRKTNTINRSQTAKNKRTLADIKG